MNREEAAEVLDNLCTRLNCEDDISGAEARAFHIALTALSGWVRTADRMPERMELLPCSVRVLINSFMGVVTAQYDFEDGIWIDFFIHKHSPFNCPNNYGETMEVTHWMPLPPLPETVGAESTKINGGE